MAVHLYGLFAGAFFAWQLGNTENLFMIGGAALVGSGFGSLFGALLAPVLRSLKDQFGSVVERRVVFCIVGLLTAEAMNALLAGVGYVFSPPVRESLLTAGRENIAITLHIPVLFWLFYLWDFGFRTSDFARAGGMSPTQKDRVRKWVDNRIEKGKENAKAPDGTTVLMVAAEIGYEEAVARLLDKGVDVNERRPKDGATALWGAARAGHMKIIERLLEKSANVDAEMVGYTPLMVAVENHHTDVAELLIRCGAAVNVKRACDGGTPLMIAVQRNLSSLVKTLLDRGADVNARDSSGGTTALYMAAQRGRTEIARSLLEKGAATDAGCEDQTTPLWIAAQNGHAEVVRLLIERGATVNVTRKDDGVSPLTMAAQCKRTDVVRVLLDSGADINAATSDGVTPLMSAACHGHEEIVRLLLARGADVAARSKTGLTALKGAMKKGDKSIAELLKQAGADK